MNIHDIEEEIRSCNECGKRGKAVPGEGNPKAGIMLVGEAPGKKESETGRPFVGRAGKYLDRLLGNAGIKRKEIYITSPVKRYPGKRRPTKEEIRHGTKHLEKQIKAVSPEIIVLMGNVAAQALLPEEKIESTKDHGRMIKKGGRNYLITVHPAAAMRFPRLQKMIESDFRKLKELT